MTIEKALEQLNLGSGINEDVSEEYNEATDMAIEALEREQKMAEIKYFKCKFIARLDDQTYHNVYVMVPDGTPDDYIWFLAIRECGKFEHNLQQLSFVEEVTTHIN